MPFSLVNLVRSSKSYGAQKNFFGREENVEITGGIPFRQDAGTGRGAKRLLYFFFSPFFVSALGLASSFFSDFSEESPFEDEPGADDFLA